MQDFYEITLFDPRCVPLSPEKTTQSGFSETIRCLFAGMVSAFLMLIFAGSVLALVAYLGGW